jgi:hypothetical protein
MTRPHRESMFNFDLTGIVRFVSKHRLETVFILIVHPLGALLVDCVQGFSHNYFVSMGLGGYLFATGFAALTPIAFASFIDKARKQFELGIHQRFVVLTAIPMVALTLFVQIVSYLELHKDAQAAVAFFIIPIYAAIAFSLYGTILFFFFRKQK